MRTPAEAQRRLETANPVISASTKPAAAWSSAVLLERIDRRSGDMQTQDKTIIEKAPKERTRRRNVAVVIGAAVIAAAVGVSVLLTAGGGGDDVAGPQETVEAFYAAFNAGDIPAATMEFFTEESEIVNHPMDTPATRGGPLVGLTAIEETLQRQRNNFLGPEAITARNIEESDETATWDTEFVNEARHLCAEGHSAVVKGGKILIWTHAPLHTCAAVPGPLSRLSP